MLSEVRFAFLLLSSAVLVNWILADVTHSTFTENVITDCPTQSRRPTKSLTINEPVHLTVNLSTNALWDSSLVIFSDFTIHRLQSLMTRCTFNITISWDETQSQFMSLPSPGIANYSHPIFVYWNDDLTVAVLYDCRSTARSYATFVRGETAHLDASYEQLADYGLKFPTIEPESPAEFLEDHTEALEQCQLFAKSQPTRFSFIPTIVIIVALVVLCVLCTVIF